MKNLTTNIKETTDCPHKHKSCSHCAYQKRIDGILGKEYPNVGIRIEEIYKYSGEMDLTYKYSCSYKGTYIALLPPFQTENYSRNNPIFKLIELTDENIRNFARAVIQNHKL